MSIISGSRPHNQALPSAPEWQISEWLNSPQPFSVESLRGRVVLAVAFQMLCPGCVSHALPQAMRVRAHFPEEEVAVVALHTIFEHHDVQGSAAALAAFLHEYRITFPVGIDARDPGDRLPKTMQLYRMRGTPTTLLIDREGRLRMNTFGHVDDLGLGVALGALIQERPSAAPDGHAEKDATSCNADGCAVP